MMLKEMKCELGTLYPVKLNLNYKGHTELSTQETSGNNDAIITCRVLPEESMTVE